MPRGRPPKIKEQEIPKKKDKYACFGCDKEYVETNFYNSFGNFYDKTGKIPYCKQCVERFYQYYFDKYTNEGCLTPEENAVKRICMAMDIYYSKDNFDSSMNKIKRDNMSISPMSQYMRTIGFNQYKDKSYDDTVSEDEKKRLSDSYLDMSNESDKEIDEKTKKFFGIGFSNEDYEFLKEEYDDWVARHECKTKAQEEVFKRICFKQLEILKATRRGEDTKNLDATFQNYLDTAKLQPKQNSGDTTADNQTFGTLIDKWENERPLPDIDEDLKDVDKIGYYINTFFKGHTCRMLNIKNAFSNLYSSMMKKFTVNKPEYNSDDEEYDSEFNFDTIFGNQSSDD